MPNGWLSLRILAGLVAIGPASFGGFIVQYFEEASLVQITGNCEFHDVSSSLSYECAGSLPIPKADPAKGTLTAVHFSVLGNMQQSFELDTSAGPPPPLDLQVSLTSLFQYRLPRHARLFQGGQSDGILSWPDAPAITRKSGLARSFALTGDLDALVGPGNYLLDVNLASLGLAEPGFPVYSNYFVGNLFAEIRYEYRPATAVPEPATWFLIAPGVPVAILAMCRQFRRRMLP